MDAHTSPGSASPSGGDPVVPGPAGTEGPDFRAVFDAMPGVNLLLAVDAPRWTMLAASDERLAATLTTREETLGRPLFEVFSDANPENDRPTGESNLRTSLETVVRTRAPHRMAVQRFDIRRPDGTWEVRHWAPRNVPVLGPDGAVRYILHHVEDVSEVVRRTEAHAKLRSEYVVSEDARHELEGANELLRDQQLELEMANQQLQEQHADLEIQADELRVAAAALEERTAEAERARAEAEAVRARTDAVLASIGDAFYLLDREWRFTHVNAAAELLLKTTAAALIGRTLWDAFPDVLGSVFERPYREAMASGRPTSAEAFFAPLLTWFDVRSYPWPGGLMVHFRDVGARHAAEAERERLLVAAEAARADAEAERARTAGILEAMADAHFVLDADFRFVSVNAATERNLGHTREQLVGRSIWELFPGTVGSIFERSYRQVATAKVAVHFVGEYEEGGLTLVPEVDAYPTPDGGVAVFWRDVRAEVQAVAERERLLAAAEAANRVKSEFLAVMSHELRTPLNAIGGYADLMEMGIRGPVTEQQREDLGRIQRSQRHLLGLVNEVLNYAKLETGTVSYELADVPVRSALTEAEALVVPQARMKGLVFEAIDCPDDLVARADPEKLRQVLVNLLGNAVKFTESRDGQPGRISVSCAPDGERVRIAVRDTGIGIAMDKLGAVFEPFVQVRATLTRTAEGTGLGLAISRDLARGMGGALTVESEPGVGSTFVLVLPRA
ncbi:MAG: domain S-box protein [Gemmatimonadetes bacterium]|nr:domain S-box protein [Gemmatimonadota bacterium]